MCISMQPRERQGRVVPWFLDLKNSLYLKSHPALLFNLLQCGSVLSE